MNHTTVINKLTELGYKGFKEAYLQQMEDVSYDTMPFSDRLYQLLDAQDIFLRNKRIVMNHRLSKIKDKQAVLDAIDYTPARQINKEQIRSLATLNFIRSKQNIIITGKTGTGKSYIAQALANKAIYEGFKVYYVRTPSLLEEIRIARVDGRRFKLLILDDFGVSAITPDDAMNLFEIIEDRTELNSTIITSQLPVSEWYNYLNNNTIADAILDRIVHSSHRIELSGPSMRKVKSTIKSDEY
ncbi:IS21-like element helper ATPase IstB [Hydrogenimonas thermophila]|uniref:IS21-like element helper ATPase IstB n=1 Tax=Hydrogenimonas thermophila TaxID=223786 RepID=UPI002936EA98|nr:IS21-like element helper ATPase IstB [Hydrogenimonas thermophila]WOE69046.1 IS21-like element helper ATPase IstB [Hydrogenimonas thermophila]WOE71556.1 IS21-like element helper ATPase IstB [Hydrogenimonas thermophila]